MTKIIERESEDVIDLGDATALTKGGTQDDPPDGVQLQRKPHIGLSAD